jgi:hypothetical protein
MSKPTRTLLIGATLGAVHLAGLTAAAHAQAVDQPLTGGALTRRPSSVPAPATARSPPATA